MMPLRTGKIWATVTVVGQEMSQTPNVVCKDCGHTFCGGNTRIVEHILSKCTCTTSELQALRAELLTEKEKKAGKAAAKAAVTAVNEAAESKPIVTGALPAPVPVGLNQMGLSQSFNQCTSEDMDKAIADLVYGKNLSFHLVCSAPVYSLLLCRSSHQPPGHTPQAESPLFKKVLAAARNAPPSYKPPDKKRMGGDLLDSTVKRLRADEMPLRESALEDGGTVVSDGWDDVERQHLINFMVVTRKGSFFDGTVKLTSKDHEDAQAVFELLAAEIERVGRYKIVQVCTDTCSVMKAAWKLIEAKYPWITCTCCGPHVLNLLIKDIAKIPEVAAVHGKVKKVLNRFWGRTRFFRTKLREVVLQHHKKKLGLYRAGPTRFAGCVREMGRMLRLKADLKFIIDSSEYAKYDFKKKKGDEAEAGEADVAGEGGIKNILQDEEGFWRPLVHALKVSPTPDGEMAQMHGRSSDFTRTPRPSPTHPGPHTPAKSRVHSPLPRRTHVTGRR